MSYEEARAWMAYGQLRGTFNQGMRMEYLFARLAHQIHHVVGGRPTEFHEFMRYHEDPEVSIDDIAKLMGVARVEKR